MTKFKTLLVLLLSMMLLLGVAGAAYAYQYQTNPDRFINVGTNFAGTPINALFNGTVDDAAGIRCIYDDGANCNLGYFTNSSRGCFSPIGSQVVIGEGQVQTLPVGRSDAGCNGNNWGLFRNTEGVYWAARWSGGLPVSAAPPDTVQCAPTDFFTHANGCVPPTPTQRITLLNAAVQALIDAGALPASNGQALINKLDSAQKQLDKGNTNAVLAKLNAFITQVNDYIANGIVSAADGQPLIDAANAIIAALS